MLKPIVLYYLSDFRSGTSCTPFTPLNVRKSCAEIVVKNIAYANHAYTILCHSAEDFTLTLGHSTLNKTSTAGILTLPRQRSLPIKTDSGIVSFVHFIEDYSCRYSPELTSEFPCIKSQHSLTLCVGNAETDYRQAIAKLVIFSKYPHILLDYFQKR